MSEKTLPCCNRLNVKMYEEKRELARQARMTARYGATPRRMAEIAKAKTRLAAADAAIARHEEIAHSREKVPA